MKKTLMYSLAGLNLALGGLLLARMLPANTAEAQVGGGFGATSTYLLIPGDATGASVGIVYVLNESQHSLAAIAPDNNDRLQAMRTIDLRQIFNQAAQQNNGR